jgi:hypothetical protein
MLRISILLLLEVLSSGSGTFAQSLIPMAPLYTLPVEPFHWKALPKYEPHRGFLKKWTIESFGFSSAPIKQDFDRPVRLTEGPFTSHGLECPFCVIRPTMERARYTLPEFGVTATRSFWNGRGEVFGQVGGVNAWKPDNVRSFVTGRNGGFSSSSNDAWLLQGGLGARVAVDQGRRLWLGGAARYLMNYGPDSRKHWNSYGVNATFVFGR